MPNQNDYRNLSDVFRELQEMQHNPQISEQHNKKEAKTKKHFNFRYSNPYQNHDLKLSHIIIGCGILIVLSKKHFFRSKLCQRRSFRNI